MWIPNHLFFIYLDKQQRLSLNITKRYKRKRKEIKQLTTFTSKAHDPHSHRHKGKPINRFNEHTFKKNLPEKKGFNGSCICLHVKNGTWQTDEPTCNLCEHGSGPRSTHSNGILSQKVHIYKTKMSQHVQTLWSSHVAIKKNIEETHTIGNIYKDKQRIGNMLVIMRLEAKNSEEPTKSYIIFQRRKKR